MDNSRKKKYPGDIGGICVLIFPGFISSINVLNAIKSLNGKLTNVFDKKKKAKSGKSLIANGINSGKCKCSGFNY